MVLASVLKDLVTSFSVLLPKRKTSEEVTVGGRITHLWNSAEVLDEGKDTSECLVYLTLDDSIGEVHVMLLQEVYQMYKDILVVGNVVLVNGLVEQFTSPDGKETTIHGIDVSLVPSQA